MSKEIVLPPHLYDRIKASAGEHGGIGGGMLFEGGAILDERARMIYEGAPYCVHGHAWGTCVRFNRGQQERGLYEEPELAMYLSWQENDRAMGSPLGLQSRVPFTKWCELLNVKRGAKASPIEAEKELAGAAS